MQEEQGKRGGDLHALSAASCQLPTRPVPRAVAGTLVVSRRGQAGYSDSLKLWRSLESWQNEGFNLDHGS
jgi:hypothetical protein